MQMQQLFISQQQLENYHIWLLHLASLRVQMNLRKILFNHSIITM